MDKMEIRLAAGQYGEIFARDSSPIVVLLSSGSNLPHIQTVFCETTTRRSLLSAWELFLSGTPQ